jgi:MFS family permease
MKGIPVSMKELILSSSSPSSAPLRERTGQLPLQQGSLDAGTGPTRQPLTRQFLKPGFIDTRYDVLETLDAIAPKVPEALQAPTEPVSISFSLLLAAARAVLFLCLVSVGGLLLPLQVEQMDQANKIAVLGIGSGLAALLSLVSNLVTGALSDRTASRFGRRRPWSFVGSIGCVLALAIMMTAGNVVVLLIGWGCLNVSAYLVFAALNALVPDQVPNRQYGTVSGIVGLALPAGSIVGAIIVGLVLKAANISYALMIAILLVVLIPYSLSLRDKVLPREYISSFDLWIFLKRLWVDPRKQPDFGWAWLTRFLSLLSYYMGFSYFFYYLQDYVHYPRQLIVQGTATLQIIGLLITMVCTLIGGWLSDRFQRRKIFVVIGSVIVALGQLIFGFFPSWTMLLIASSLLGIGFGISTSVFLALITQVLPSAHERAKDLGVFNIANTLPHAVAPVVAALFITQFHSYPLLFVASALITLLSGGLIQRIKSVP